MLLRHEAGVPHRVTTDLEEVLPQSAASVVALAKERELLFEPAGMTSSLHPAGGSVFSTPRDLLRLMCGVVGGVFGSGVTANLVDGEVERLNWTVAGTTYPMPRVVAGDAEH